MKYRVSKHTNALGHSTLGPQPPVSVSIDALTGPLPLSLLPSQPPWISVPLTVSVVAIALFSSAACERACTVYLSAATLLPLVTSALSVVVMDVRPF